MYSLLYAGMVWRSIKKKIFFSFLEKAIFSEVTCGDFYTTCYIKECVFVTKWSQWLHQGTLTLAIWFVLKNYMASTPKISCIQEHHFNQLMSLSISNYCQFIAAVKFAIIISCKSFSHTHPLETLLLYNLQELHKLVITTKHSKSMMHDASVPYNYLNTSKWAQNSENECCASIFWMSIFTICHLCQSDLSTKICKIC